MRINKPIQGIDEANKILSAYPEDVTGMVRSSFRTAGSWLKRRIMAATPTPFKDIVFTYVSSASQAKDGLVMSHTGLSRTKDRMRWFKAYWINYGTNANRDPQHKFANRARHPQWKGINPRRFFDQAVDGQENEFMRRYEDDFVKRFNKKYAK